MMQKKMAVLILSILQLVGIYGFVVSWEAVIRLTPVNLLLQTGVLVYFGFKDGGSRLLVYALIGWTCGFLIEAIGVNTGWPFGNYTYHEVFGLKLFETPLLIGANWIILLIGSASLMNTLLGKKVHFVIIITLGALAMTILDFIIEPVAIEYRFWTWDKSSIPLSNYLSWFGVSFVLLWIKRILLPDFKSNIANVIFILHLIFFLVINIFISW
jgi:putative membrane protein